MKKDPLVIDRKDIPNAVIRRLVEEIKNERAQVDAGKYNRIHNRHNRGR